MLARGGVLMHGQFLNSSPSKEVFHELVSARCKCERLLTMHISVAILGNHVTYYIYPLW